MSTEAVDEVDAFVVLEHDRRYRKAAAHPMRERIMNVAIERATINPKQLADEFNASLGTVSYHVRRLVTLGFLELEKEVVVRGAFAHFYRLRDDTLAASTAARPRHVAASVQRFHARLDRVAMRTLHEQLRIVEQLLGELQAESTVRAQAEGEAAVPLVSIAIFASATDSGGDPDAANLSTRRASGISATARGAD